MYTQQSKYFYSLLVFFCLLFCFCHFKYPIKSHASVENRGSVLFCFPFSILCLRQLTGTFSQNGVRRSPKNHNIIELIDNLAPETTGLESIDCHTCVLTPVQLPLSHTFLHPRAPFVLLPTKHTCKFVDRDLALSGTAPMNWYHQSSVKILGKKKFEALSFPRTDLAIFIAPLP